MKLINLILSIGSILLLLASCKKDDAAVSAPTSLTVTDIDGNIYHTIVIGQQTWMVEDLKVTKLNDGTPIPLISDDKSWSTLTTTGYCWLNNDASKYKDLYGGLYNWSTIKTGKLCPSGWHVPSHADWISLITFLGGDAVAGGKLKEYGTVHWPSPNAGATNETGFTAFPTGGHYYDGTWWSDFGNYWTSTEVDSLVAYNMNLHASDGGIYHDQNKKGCGFSVRCIKD